MKAKTINELLEAGTAFLKEATVYLKHQRETYDAQVKALNDETKMLEQLAAPMLKKPNGNETPAVDFAKLFGGDGK